MYKNVCYFLLFIVGMKQRKSILIEPILTSKMIIITSSSTPISWSSTFFYATHDTKFGRDYSCILLPSICIHSHIYHSRWLTCLFFVSPRDSGEGYSNSGCLSVTLTCLRDNLSKHGWIWMIFCMWLEIIIILDGVLTWKYLKQGFWRKILVFGWKFPDFENCVLFTR